MKFAVGYQLRRPGEEPLADIVRDFADSIEEVYFPWVDLPTCRVSLTSRRGFVDWSGQKRLEQDLASFLQMGIKLDLLFNANCYGQYAVSQYLVNLVCSVIEHLQDVLGSLDVVTTTSLTIARTVKQNFPKIEVRASVNMRIGTIKGMEYVADLFDSFYVQREYNRDLERIQAMKSWAETHGKRLHLLANSGCLNFCSGQVFHDNLVAHAAEAEEIQNLPNWNPCTCWNYYREKNHWVSFLQNSWIRPEDIDNYQKYFSVLKLATRMHANPRKVIQAYAERKFNGNLLDLLEPGHGPLFPGYVGDNSRFPEDWFGRTTGCDKRCDRCSYCHSVLQRVLVNVEDYQDRISSRKPF